MRGKLFVRDASRPEQFFNRQGRFLVEHGAMSRLLFFAVIAAVVYGLLKSYRKQLPADEDTPVQAEDMVRCVHCGVHLPKHESILVDGKYYCGEPHRHAHANKPR